MGATQTFWEVPAHLISSSVLFAVYLILANKIAAVSSNTPIPIKVTICFSPSKFFIYSGC